MAFVLLFFGILIGVLEFMSGIVEKRDFQNYSTDSNTLIIEKDKQYDFVLLGISHARNFSRHKNHQRVESKLDKSFINLAQGGGACGANEQLFYLKYFFKKGNSVSNVVYFLSPPMFYSENMAKSSMTFYRESFKTDFFIEYLLFKSVEKKPRLTEYIKSKLSEKWLDYQPFSFESMDDIMESMDSTKIEAGIKLAYRHGMKEENFNMNCKIIEETIKQALDNNANVKFVIPPAVFGEWPGHDAVLSFCAEMKAKYNVEYYDFSRSVMDTNYYYDHHHLNTTGIEYFTKKYLDSLFQMKK